MLGKELHAGQLDAVNPNMLMGGHDVPVSDIRRRFARSLNHFVHDYAPLADRWAV